MDAVIPFVIVGVPIAVAIASATTTLVTERACWGCERSPVSAGEGAYREGVVARGVPRRIPGRVAVAAIAATAWGAVTLFLLVPAGGLLALIALAGAIESRGGLYAAYALVASVAVISGVVHAASLCATGDALARRGAACCQRVRASVRHARWHHAAIWLVLPLPLLVDGIAGWARAAAILAVPCGLGLLVAELLVRAGAAVERLDARDAAQDTISTGSPTAISTAS